MTSRITSRVSIYWGSHILSFPIPFQEVTTLPRRHSCTWADCWSCHGKIWSNDSFSWLTWARTMEGDPETPLSQGESLPAVLRDYLTFYIFICILMSPYRRKHTHTRVWSSNTVNPAITVLQWIFIWFLSSFSHQMLMSDFFFLSSSSMQKTQVSCVHDFWKKRCQNHGHFEAFLALNRFKNAWQIKPKQTNN